MLNLSQLFYVSDSTRSALLDNLELTAQQRLDISDAKTEIRECLKIGIPKVLQNRGYEGHMPRPRFFTQGSWAYKTLNAPAKTSQQADCDDGTYLPLSFVSLGRRPSVASTIFFSAAEEALAPLVKMRQWQLFTDKPTCIRVEISRAAHIDVPLYAIPDNEFTTLTKAALDRAYGTLEEAVRLAERDAWTALPSDSVLLAHREKDWVASDPRLVKDWFVSEVESKGIQLRRVVRYLKAFRDWNWERGGPSSILLMSAAAPIFERREQRDDIAFLDVVTALPAALRRGVNNPVDSSESLTGRLGAIQVEEAAVAYQSLADYLRGAINLSNHTQAIAWMREKFGPRFPNEPEWIKPVSVAATIASAPPSRGPSELVGRTKAG